MRECFMGRCMLTGRKEGGMNENEQHLRNALSTLDVEFKRQLELERDRKANIK